MTTTAELALTELDLLATYAGTRPPFPLRVPSSGRFADERAELLAEAGRTLAARGLATEHGPAGIAADLVAALREQRNAVDLVVAGHGTVTGAVAMIRGHRALVCGQPIGGTPGPVTVTRVTAADLTGELAKRIPKARGVPAMPITLPPGFAERGADGDAIDALTGLLPSVRGRGQLGAVRRAGDGVERPLELSWLDGPQGRVRVDRDTRGWVSVNPLRHGELVQALREAAALARG